MAVLLVFSMFQDAEAARTVGRTVVEEQLAACANVIPGAESIYWWKGIIETSTEVLAVFKTTDALYPRLEARVKELHPYEVPEIVAVEISSGLPAYLQWVAASVLS